MRFLCIEDCSVCYADEHGKLYAGGNSAERAAIAYAVDFLDERDEHEVRVAPADAEAMALPGWLEDEYGKHKIYSVAATITWSAKEMDPDESC